MFLKKEQIIGVLAFIIFGELIASLIWFSTDKNYFILSFCLSILFYLSIGQIIRFFQKKKTAL